MNKNLLTSEISALKEKTSLIIDEFFSLVIDEFFRQNPDIVQEYISKHYLEKKALRKIYDRLYEVISLMNIRKIKYVRKLIITVLAETYYTTEDNIKAIIRQTISTIPKNNYQHHSSSLYL